MWMHEPKWEVNREDELHSFIHRLRQQQERLSGCHDVVTIRVK